MYVHGSGNKRKVMLVVLLQAFSLSLSHTLLVLIEGGNDSISFLQPTSIWLDETLDFCHKMKEYILIWPTYFLSVVPNSLQPSLIMLQRGRDHVGALLSHHEVPARRPSQLQQRPLRPLQGSAPKSTSHTSFVRWRLHSSPLDLWPHSPAPVRVTPPLCCMPCGPRRATWRKTSSSTSVRWTPPWRDTQSRWGRSGMWKWLLSN